MSSINKQQNNNEDLSELDARYISLMFRIRKYIEQTRHSISEIEEILNSNKNLGVEKREELETTKKIYEQNIAKLRFSGFLDEYIERS